MDTCTIGLRRNGERFINYNYLDTNIPSDTDILTLKELEPSILDRIKEATIEDVQIILAKYL